MKKENYFTSHFYNCQIKQWVSFLKAAFAKNYFCFNNDVFIYRIVDGWEFLILFLLGMAENVKLKKKIIIKIKFYLWKPYSKNFFI